MFMANNGCQIIKINKHKKEMKTKLFTLCLMSCIVTQAQTIDSMAVRLQAMADIRQRVKSFVFISFLCLLILMI